MQTGSVCSEAHVLEKDYLYSDRSRLFG